MEGDGCKVVKMNHDTDDLLKYVYSFKKRIIAEVDDLIKTIKQQNYTSIQVAKKEDIGNWYTITFVNSSRVDIETFTKRVYKVTRSKQVDAIMWTYWFEIKNNLLCAVISIQARKYIEYKKVGAFNKGDKFTVESVFTDVNTRKLINETEMVQYNISPTEVHVCSESYKNIEVIK